jgi:hypothetical protein
MQMPIYKPPTPKGYPAWYKPDEEDGEAQAKIGQTKQDAMLAAGSYPTKEYLDSIAEEDERLKVIGNARAIIDEFVQDTFFRPIGDWLRANKWQYPVLNVVSEQGGYRVLIDFATPEGQQEFLRQHRKWTTEKPHVWWDRPGIRTVRERYGRNEKHDLVMGKREKDE